MKAVRKPRVESSLDMPTGRLPLVNDQRPMLEGIQDSSLGVL